MGATVVVVTAHGHPTLLESGYLVRHVAEHWRARGVRFLLAVGPHGAPPGDVGWQHLDATRVGRAYQRLLARYPVRINGGEANVEKQNVASHLVGREDDWQGPVIVKTALNYGGRADDWAASWRPLRHPMFHRLRNGLPAWLTGRMDPRQYPVYEEKAAVPGWIWRDRRLVVQRFLAEREGGRYAIRRWFFFGPCEFGYRSLSSDAIVMGDDHPAWETLAEVPPELRTLRTRLALDYGKIDYAVVGGEAVVYDVNPAVSTDGPPGCPIQQEVIRALVPGLGAFLGEGRD